MSNPIGDAFYLATLKWKRGELRALGTLKGAGNDLAVLFDMPPAGDFDHDLGRILEPTEHIRQFGPKLQKVVGRRGVFIDALKIDDERHREGLAVHPLTELLERARLAGALAFPVTSLGRTAEYQAAVERFVASSPSLPICVRVDALSQFDEITFVMTEIDSLLRQLRCAPGRVMLNLDFGAFEPHDHVGFALLVKERLNSLPQLYDWLNVAVTMTSFPVKPKISAGDRRRFRRLDWLTYLELCNGPGELLRRPMFGDYAVEAPGATAVGKISPVAQIRYTSPVEYLICKGKTTKKPNGYQAIFPVADDLLLQNEFMGSHFSLGDTYFAELAKNKKSPGNASTWRWASTDHHLTRVLADLRAVFSLPMREAATVPSEPEQLEFVV